MYNMALDRVDPLEYKSIYLRVKRLKKTGSYQIDIPVQITTF